MPSVRPPKSRGRALVHLALLVAAGCWPRLAAGSPPDPPHAALLVGNDASGTVSVIDPATGAVSCERDVVPDRAARVAALGLVQRAVNWYAGDGYADDLDVSPDGGTLYVSRPSFADVVALDLASGSLLWRVELAGYRSDHIKLDPAGERLYASAVTAGRVQVIDTRTQQIVGELATGSRPHGLDLTADGQLLVGELKGDALTVADARTLAVTRRIPLAAGVRPFVATADGRTAYVQLSDFHGFQEVDLTTGRVIRTIELPQTEAAQAYHGHYPKDAAHHGISLTPDDRTLCIAATASDAVALVERPGLALAAMIPVGTQPAWTVTSPDGRYCYASSRGAGTVSVIELATRREVRRIKVGAYPLRMVWSARGCPPKRPGG